MNRIEELLTQFQEIAEHPRKQLDEYLAAGKKVIACFPYYVPEEIIDAAGIVPFGLWGRKGAPILAGEYFPTYFCSLVQMGMEMVLDGTLDGVSAVLCTCLCDTLRPTTQNLKSAGRYPVIFLAHPQNRKYDFGVKFMRIQYEKLKMQVERIAGKAITDEDLTEAIRRYNRERRACRRFVELAGRHPEAVSAVKRSAVLKSRFFMSKAEHTVLLEELNRELERLPESDWDGTKVVLSGIMADHPKFLQLLDDNRIAVAADDLAHESRCFRCDASEEGDPMEALARQFSAQDDDPLLYDPEIDRRPGHVAVLVEDSSAQGVIVLRMTFCDPEEMEYPSLKKALDAKNIPMLSIGYDHQITDFGQAATSIQAFSDLLDSVR